MRITDLVQGVYYLVEHVVFPYKSAAATAGACPIRRLHSAAVMDSENCADLHCRGNGNLWEFGGADK